MSAADDSSVYPNEHIKKIIHKIIDSEHIENPIVDLSNATNKGDNYLGVIYRVHVTGTKENGDKGQVKLILKWAPSFARDKFPVDMIYKREFYAYTTILPKLHKLQIDHDVPEADRFEFIKCYGGDLSYLHEVIAMEDMNAHGFKMGNRRESLDIDHVLLLVKTLASLHATSFALKNENPDCFDRFAKEIYDSVDYKDSFRQSFEFSRENAQNAMDDELCKQKFTDFSSDAFDKFFEYINGDLYSPYAVLCHGDCWTNNMLFKYENDKPVEVRLLDWQMIKHASPVVDIAYLIFSSTDEELRRKHYERLLELYYDSLKSNLAKLDCDINVCYPEPIYKEHIKKVMPFGLIMAFLTAPMFMSEEDDIPDMAELLKKETFEKEDMQLKNVKSQHRYEQRIRGVVRDFVRLDLI